MKQGFTTLNELAAEVTNLSAKKRDFVAPLTETEMVVVHEDDKLVPKIAMNSHGEFDIAPQAHRQMATHIGIPKRYYDRMLNEHPDLLAANVNRWWENDEDTSRLFRTFDAPGDRLARAYLSDRYRVIDNEVVLEAALRALREVGVEANVASSGITERRLYLKVTFPSVETEVTRGDIVRSGFVLSNSEIGLGSVKVERFVERLVCVNGMILPATVSKNHLGGRQSEGEIDFSLDTQKAQNATLLLELRDAMRSMMDRESFDTVVDKFRALSELHTEARPKAVVEVTQKKLGLSETEGDSVLEHLIGGGDLTAWGLANAITRTAEDSDDYDRATELEAVGGKVLELNPSDWADISTGGDGSSDAKSRQASAFRTALAA